MYKVQLFVGKNDILLKHLHLVQLFYREALAHGLFGSIFLDATPMELTNVNGIDDGNRGNEDFWGQWERWNYYEELKIDAEKHLVLLKPHIGA